LFANFTVDKLDTHERQGGDFKFLVDRRSRHESKSDYVGWGLKLIMLAHFPFTKNTIKRIEAGLLFDQPNDEETVVNSALSYI
jgi:hypothetical protein